ncbi:MAG: hypothetical protein HY319_06715 [Armatimonadetes bacterium]|nr:hypothetical protein [Armatimonadota bacterium]
MKEQWFEMIHQETGVPLTTLRMDYSLIRGGTAPVRAHFTQLLWSFFHQPECGRLAEEPHVRRRIGAWCRNLRRRIARAERVVPDGLTVGLLRVRFGVRLDFQGAGELPLARVYVYNSPQDSRIFAYHHRPVPAQELAA